MTGAGGTQRSQARSRPSAIAPLLFAFGACTLAGRAASPADPVFPGDPPQSAARTAAHTAPYGLDCRTCQKHRATSCPSLARAPLAAIAAGTRRLDQHQDCYTFHDPELGDQLYCSIAETLEFETLQVLRAPAGPPPLQTDRFSTGYRTEGGDTTAPVEGVHIATPERFVIFAAPTPRGASTRARWTISAACPLTQNPDFSAPPAH
jgi:hypothetical protein